MPRLVPFGTLDCTCQLDDYADEWRVMADCPQHGEAEIIACRRHPGCNCPRHGERHPAAAYDPPPAHYVGDGGLDPWRYIEAHGLDYWAGNVIKYVTRAGRKEIATVEEDLIKARNFLNYMIERERKGE